jgi:hypothetical protein
MALVSGDTFRDRFTIKSDVPVQDAVSAAGASIEEWVGAEAYTDSESETPSNPARAARLRLAELYLAMYYFYPTASLQIESGVIVATDRSEGDVVRSFETPKQRQEGRQGYYDMALDLAAPYRVVEASQDVDLPETTYISVRPVW